MKFLKWIFRPLEGERKEFRKVCDENKAIRNMPEITPNQIKARHEAVIAARQRRTGGSNWRIDGIQKR